MYIAPPYIWSRAVDMLIIRRYFHQKQNLPSFEITVPGVPTEITLLSSNTLIDELQLHRPRHCSTSRIHLPAETIRTAS